MKDQNLPLQLPLNLISDHQHIKLNSFKRTSSSLLSPFPQLTIFLLHSISELEITDTSEINWNSLAKNNEEELNGAGGYQLRKQWANLIGHPIREGILDHIGSFFLFLSLASFVVIQG